MKLKRNTWLLILIALSLGSWTYLAEIRPKQQKVATLEQEQQLFQLQKADISRIEIERPDLALKFVKTSNDLQPWQMKYPQNSTASDGRISFLLDLLVNGKKEHSFMVNAAQLSQYGLDQPIAKVKVELKNGKVQQIILGQPGIQPETIYAQIFESGVDKERNEVILVSKNWQYAVEPELEAWQQSN